MSHLQSERDRYFMSRALDEARAALTAGDIPAGCVIVIDEKIVASARNSRHATHSKTAHAELNAIKSVEVLLEHNRNVCEIFVTLEPCMMCFGAIICSRFGRLVFGARDYFAGATMAPPFNEHYCEFAPEIVAGVCVDECIELLKGYVLQNGTRANWLGRYFGFVP